MCSSNEGYRHNNPLNFRTTKNACSTLEQILGSRSYWLL
jgi:hypothetical protein